jgi:dTDP-4-dehydrorhamnose reductase
MNPKMPIRIAVTGCSGQVVRALCDAKEEDIQIIPIGRPYLDLACAETIEPALRETKPDLIVNAAAYTNVDRAEKKCINASLVNTGGAGRVARAAYRLSVPVIQLSTDYVFDGNKGWMSAYTEEDFPGPINVYGATKWLGEKVVAESTNDVVILRTSWVYDYYGRNFLNAMLNSGREEVRVIADQTGTPTYAPDLAKAIIGIARNLLASPGDPALRGIFHFSGGGETTSWAGFAEEIFALRASRGLSVPKMIPISTAEYPTFFPGRSAARRPANSRLNCEKLSLIHGIQTPNWKESLASVLQLCSPCNNPSSNTN